jgi:hypothetical protein
MALHPELERALTAAEAGQASEATDNTAAGSGSSEIEGSEADGELSS